MNKTILILGIIFLLFEASINQSAGMNVEKKSIRITNEDNTLYVGGNGPGNYTKIQDAINNASDGDTVFVYDESSPYFENIIINKSIFLIGENKYSTIIDGEETGGHVIRIVVNQVHLSGFTIQNCGGIPNDAEVCISSNNNEIYNNIITCIPHHGETGLWLYHSSGNLIFENTIEHHHYGIWLENSLNNNLSYNNILDMWSYAIILGDSKDNIIFNNIICNNSGGIYLRDSCNNEISRNLIGWNYRGIILMDQESFSSDNNIIKNIFKNNGKIDASFSMNRGAINNNFWDKNFWNKPLNFAKMIIGSRQLFYFPGIPFHFPGMWIVIPWVTFDWHPAKEPYDI
ncbi:hypothetical protein AYK20_06850 [Thermoplasmatales archaeon SG8-52-1]|nr:MAG: hypothetical protein AYK20_06850 [Thermoplasmatales archaeon SG8-52-1]